MKRVFLLRHAKTEQVNKDTPADAARTLTERGRKDSPRIGRAMREKGYQPDRVLCSTSARTRETWELTNAELHSLAKVEFLESLYAASAREIVQMIRELPDTVNKPLLVGHNPGFEECAALLAHDSADPSAHFRFDSIQEKFPTAALVVLDFKIAHWKELAPHTGTLADFIRPKDLE
ncbi:MAG TPA: histidine phosphatase family protein [Rhizomicrobium sp.]|jgi:phosphohistidine phosphatase